MDLVSDSQKSNLKSSSTQPVKADSQGASALDVGCGPHCLEGAVGIDQFEFAGVDYVHDLNVGPWPLPESSFSFIRCQHVIEHVQNLRVLAQEMYRVAKDGAEIDFVTPHYSSYASYGDPTHLYHFALASIPLLFEQVVGSQNFEVVSNSIHFTGSAIEFPGWLIYKLSPKQYEKHFAWIFPANEIRTRLRIKKTKLA